MKIFLKTWLIFLKLKYEEVFKDFLFPLCKTVLQIVGVSALFILIIGIVIGGTGYLAIGATKFISPSFLAQWVSFASHLSKNSFDPYWIFPGHFFMAMTLGMHTVLVVILSTIVVIASIVTAKFLRNNWVKASEQVRAQVEA